MLKKVNYRTAWAMASIPMEQITRGYMGVNGISGANHKSMDWLRKKNLVGGLEHEFYFPIYWECYHPN